MNSSKISSIVKRKKTLLVKNIKSYYSSRSILTSTWTFNSIVELAEILASLVSGSEELTVNSKGIPFTSAKSVISSCVKEIDILPVAGSVTSPEVETGAGFSNNWSNSKNTFFDRVSIQNSELGPCFGSTYRFRKVPCHKTAVIPTKTIKGVKMILEMGAKLKVLELYQWKTE